MANDAIKNEVADKLFDQVKGIIEGGSGGEIKIIRNRDEAEAARQRMIEETARRIETDPLVIELAKLELEFRIAASKVKAEDEAAAAAPVAEVVVGTTEAVQA